MADKVIMTMGVGSGAVLARRWPSRPSEAGCVVTNIHPALGDERHREPARPHAHGEAGRRRPVRLGQPRADIPKLLDLYREGQLDLDGLVTKTYTLEGVNEGYEDMRAGRNIRGVMVYN